LPTTAKAAIRKIGTEIQAAESLASFKTLRLRDV
jgi:hypothetical protein